MSTTYAGFYKGIVSNTNDPEKRGRIKCLIPDVLGDKIESAWCEPCVPVAYDTGGDFCLPQPKETIWIAFEKGDPNFPVYLGNWWQKETTPLGKSYGSSKNKVRIINYADCTITMKNGEIVINVGAGVCDLKIVHDKVTVDGSLEVKGNVSCYNLNAGNVNAYVGKNGGGIVHADTRVDAPNV